MYHLIAGVAALDFASKPLIDHQCYCSILPWLISKSANLIANVQTKSSMQDAAAEQIGPCPMHDIIGALLAAAQKSCTVCHDHDDHACMCTCACGKYCENTTIKC